MVHINWPFFLEDKVKTFWLRQSPIICTLFLDIFIKWCLKLCHLTTLLGLSVFLPMLIATETFRILQTMVGEKGYSHIPRKIPVIISWQLVTYFVVLGNNNYRYCSLMCVWLAWFCTIENQGIIIILKGNFCFCNINR